MLNEAVMPVTQNTVRKASAKWRAAALREKYGKNLGVNAGGQQDEPGDRHAYEKLNLVVQQAAIVQRAYQNHQRRARENAETLGNRLAAGRYDNSQQYTAVNCDSAE